MKFFIAILPAVVLLVAVQVQAANLRPTRQIHTSAFYSQGDAQGIPVTVRGLVQSFGIRQDIPADSLLGHPAEKSLVTVRLFSDNGISVGDELFIIDKNHLITGRIKVTNIYSTVSLGCMLTGTGNFRSCSLRDRVVQLRSEEYSDAWVINKGKGDYFAEEGDDGRALAEYKKALQADHRNPAVRLAMGKIYYKQGIFSYAYREYEEAAKNISRLYDNEDKYELYKGMALIRLREIREMQLPKDKRDSYRKQGIAHSEAALKIYPDSAEVNYYLGLFYYKQSFMPEDEDTLARDCFLKVVEAEPTHEGANIALSQLYLKHRNKAKAEFYAEQALRGAPASSRARELLDTIRQRQ